MIQSAQDWVRSYLDGLGYSSLYELTDAYPDGSDVSPLTLTNVVVSMGNRQAGRDAELGGPAAIEPVTLLIDVLGKDQRIGENIAGHVKDLTESGRLFPLNDYAAGGAFVKNLYIRSSFLNRVYVGDPSPWQQYWHIVSLTVEDDYNRPMM